MPAMGKRRDESQWVREMRECDSRRRPNRKDDRWRNEIRAGKQIFLAKRAMSGIIRERRAPMPGLYRRDAARRNRRRMNVGLGDEAGLDKGQKREYEQHPPPHGAGQVPAVHSG